LKFVKDSAPDYVFRRAVSIYQELWPVPEKSIVLGYLDWKVKEHPELAKLRRQLLLTDSKLKYLHLGFE